jgi:hypothetical protein
MKGHGLRLIILLWFGWYLSGPICETVDHWDGPRQEANDIFFHAGGGLVVLAAAALVAPRLLKGLREVIAQSFAPNLLWQFAPQAAVLTFVCNLPLLMHGQSPPLSLRI